MTNSQNANNNQNQQQNNQQGSLLRRVANNNNVNNTNNNQNQLTNNQNNNQNNNNSLRSRFGNGNRFGNNQQPMKPTWTITPMADAGVKFMFQGIGDPLFRVLGTPIDKSFTDVNGFVEKLMSDDELCQRLTDRLDEAWEVYDFSGAVMMHPLRKNTEEAFTLPLMPIEPEPQENADNANNDNNFTPPVPPAPIASPFQMYRAVDASFVLNILGRVRGNVLVEGTPLALEAGFLNQSYICDDPRIIELALATSAIMEAG
jgi:hypothetical protein